MAFSRLGTKLGGVLGQVQRTEYDSKIRDGITRYETSKDQVEKILDRVKDTTPSVSGLSKHEKLSQTKEKETTVAFNQQKRTVEALIDQIPNHYNVQAGCMKAYAQHKSEYHANVAQHLTAALQGMS